VLSALAGLNPVLLCGTALQIEQNCVSRRLWPWLHDISVMMVLFRKNGRVHLNKGVYLLPRQVKWARLKSQLFSTTSLLARGKVVSIDTKNIPLFQL
jgi:hypothetical protein